MNSRERFAVQRADRHAGIVVLLVSALILGLHSALFLPFLNGTTSLLGHDYAYGAPNLLAGYFWYHRNGLLSLPWFTPGLCGGVPFYANPQIPYISIAQALTFVFDPVTAVCMSFVVLTWIGYWGTYWLMRRGFGVNPWAAVIAAAVFAFNGFMVHRFIVGHVNFAHIAVTPLIAGCLVVPPRSGWKFFAAAMLPASLLLALLIQAGIGSILIPVLLSIEAVLLLHSLVRGTGWHTQFRFAAAVLLAACLSAAKLNAGLAFLAQFPRDYYPLPGFDSLWHSAMVALHAVFGAPPLEMNALWTRNAFTGLQQHELEYGVSLVPLLLAAVAAPVALRKWRPSKPAAARLLLLGALAVLFAIPIVLNWYQPQWNAFLKQLPIIGTSSTLVRWFCLYIPAISVGAGLLMQGIGWSQPAIATAALAVLLLGNAAEDRSFYRHQPYDPSAVVDAYRKVKQGGALPRVDNVEVTLDKDGRIQLPADRNDSLARGNSQLACYETFFGYGLEKFPLKQLRPGPVLGSLDQVHLNLKNPACYVYPDDNNCKPGDQFLLSERTEAEEFAGYEPFAFRVSAAQRISDGVNLVALLVAGGVGAWLLVDWLLRRAAAVRLLLRRRTGSG